MIWTHTTRGRALDLLDPKPDDVDLDEVALSLGNQCRYNGCVRRFYSVAEHSVLLAEWLEDQRAPRSVVLGGLLHDGAEAYTGDITHPVQAVLFGTGPNAVRGRFRAMQHRLDGCIVAKVNERAGRSAVSVADLHCAAVKAADLRILLDERRALLTEPPPRPWEIEQPPFSYAPLGVEIQGWDPVHAARMWTETLDRLLR